MSNSRRPASADFKPRAWMTAAMIRKGYTQADMAELVGVSTTAIALIECGARIPSIPTARKICAALDEDATRFIEEAENAG